MEHPITTPVALGRLATEIQATLALSEPPPLSCRNPGQPDDDGHLLPGVVITPEGLDKAKVRAVLDAHTPPPPVDHAAEFGKAVNAIDTSKVTDLAAKAALDAIKAVLTGGKGPGAEPRKPSR